jgi:hypothetical protein
MRISRTKVRPVIRKVIRCPKCQSKIRVPKGKEPILEGILLPSVRPDPPVPPIPPVRTPQPTSPTEAEEDLEDISEASWDEPYQVEVPPLLIAVTIALAIFLVVFLATLLSA